MSLLDIGIVAVIAISLGVGVVRGFIREVLSLSSWVLALWIAYRYAEVGAAWFAAYIAQPQLQIAAAFAALFIVTLLAASLLGYWLGRLLTVSGIGGVDRSLGMLFGFARGVLVIAVLLLAGILTGFTSQPWWRESLLIELFVPLADVLRGFFPPELEVYFAPRGVV